MHSYQTFAVVSGEALERLWSYEVDSTHNLVVCLASRHPRDLMDTKYLVADVAQHIAYGRFGVLGIPYINSVGIGYGHATERSPRTCDRY